MTKNVLQKVITPQTSDMSSHNIWQDLDQIKLRKSGGHFFALEYLMESCDMGAEAIYVY